MARRAQKSSSDGTLIQQIVNYSDLSFLAFVEMDSQNHSLTIQPTVITPPDHSEDTVAKINNSQSATTEETLEQRIERIKREKFAKEQTPEQKMVAMSDEELENYLISTGALEK